MDSQQRCIAPISGYAPIIGFPQGWPPGNRQGIPGNVQWVNGALLKNKLFWRVRTLIVLLKLTRQTPEMHLWDLLDIGQSYVTVKIPDRWHFAEVFFVRHHVLVQSLGCGMRKKKFWRKDQKKEWYICCYCKWRYSVWGKIGVNILSYIPRIE